MRHQALLQKQNAHGRFVVWRPQLVDHCHCTLKLTFFKRVVDGLPQIPTHLGHIFDGHGCSWIQVRTTAHWTRLEETHVTSHYQLRSSRKHKGPHLQQPPQWPRTLFLNWIQRRHHHHHLQLSMDHQLQMNSTLHVLIEPQHNLQDSANLPLTRG